MCRIRFLGIAIAVLVAAAVTYYFSVTYDPHAPRDDWPILEEAVMANDAAKVLVGPNVHVSASLDEFWYWECVLAAHPEDPQRLFTAVMHWRENDVDVAGFYSEDGGASWRLGCDLPAPPGKRHPDPTVAFGPDGIAYLVHMQSELSNAPFGGDEGGELQIHASPDGGKTWEKRAVVPNYIDRPWIAVDTTGGPHRGTLYCIGNIDEPIVYTSIDGGRTVRAALTPLEGRKLVNCRPANPAVTTDGTVVFVYQDRYVKRRHTSGKGWPRPKTDTLRSTNGGRTLTRSTPVDTEWWHNGIHSSPNSIAGADSPQLAADPGSRRLAGRVYCVWNDGQGDSTRVFFSASPNSGATWGRPTVISEQSMQADPDSEYASFIPCIAVNNKGVIAVSWYDRRGLPKSNLIPIEGEAGFFERETDGWNVRLRVSLDGGATWLPSVQLNEEPSRGEAGDVGHTAGLAAAADGRFHATWIDNRTGTNQLWSATVQISAVGE